MTQKSKLDSQIKKTIVEALIKVVENAPTRPTNLNYGYSNYNNSFPNFNPYQVTQSRFNVWIDYVHSILRLTSQYVDANLCFSVQSNIQSIVMQPTSDYNSKTNNICQLILDFAQSIIQL